MHAYINGIDINKDHKLKNFIERLRLDTAATSNLYSNKLGLEKHNATV